MFQSNNNNNNKTVSCSVARAIIFHRKKLAKLNTIFFCVGHLKRKIKMKLLFWVESIFSHRFCSLLAVQTAIQIVEWTESDILFCCNWTTHTHCRARVCCWLQSMQRKIKRNAFTVRVCVGTFWMLLSIVVGVRTIIKCHIGRYVNFK